MTAASTWWAWVGHDLLCPSCARVAKRQDEDITYATVRDLFERGTTHYGIRCDTCFCPPIYNLEEAMACL